MAPTRHYGDGAVDNMVGCIANSLSNSTPRQALEVAISFLFLFFFARYDVFNGEGVAAY